MAIIFIVVAGIAFLFQALQPTQYTAQASIFVNPRPQQSVAAGAPTPVGTNPDSALVDSQIEFLNSRFVAGEIVDRLDLVKDPLWNSALRPASLLSALKSTARAILSGGGSSTASSTGLDRENVITKVADAINASRHGTSYVVRIKVRSQSATQSAEIANEIVEIYRVDNIGIQEGEANRASLWLKDQLDTLKVDVEEKENRLEQFRNETGLFKTNDELFPERRLQNAEQLVLEAQADLTDKEARISQLETLISRGTGSETLPEALTSQVIQDLRSREALLKTQQLELETAYGSRYPQVISGREALREIRQQIRSELNRIVTDARAEVGIAQNRVAALEKKLREAQEDIVSQNSDIVRLRDLEAEATTARQAYDRLLERRQEIESQDKFINPTMRVLETAAVPSVPTSPKLSLALLIAICLGLGSAGLAGLVADQLDSEKTLSAEQLSDQIGYPVVASIPDLRRSSSPELLPETYALKHPHSAYAEALRTLLVSVLNTKRVQQNGTGAEIVSFMSALPIDGKTSLSLSAARLAAFEGSRVLLIDCDHRRHEVSRRCGFQSGGGLVEVLAGHGDWRQFLFTDRISGLQILPARSDQAETTRFRIAPSELDAFLQDVSGDYDLIIQDAPPILSVAETRMIAGLCDQVYLIAQSQKTKLDTLNAAIAQIRGYSAPLRGLVLDGVDLGAAGRWSHGDSLYFRESRSSYYSS